jgi:phospholipid/cholesterol/gamma-HCH transport system substrate-binding protein
MSANSFIMEKKKEKDKGQNIKLGATVLVTIVALIAGLYMIGDQKNLFDKTFIITAKFRDVAGLIEGNNVRFGGVDIGTVESVEIDGDTSVLVMMSVKEEYRSRIHTSSVALVSNDGVMGNKLVTISSPVPGEPIKDGMRIKSMNAVSMEETTRTLSATNDNLKEITNNVKNMTQKLDSSALWMVLADSAVANNIRQASYDLSESMKAFSESFLVKGLQWKNDKRLPKSDDRKKNE